MKTPRLMVLVVIGVAIVALVRPTIAQDTARPTSGCGDLNWPPLPADDLAYLDAMDLARTLTGHQFIVACVAPSKMTGMFEAQEGAAVFRTTAGSFEALFLFSPLTFDELQVVERREGGRFLYSFSGRPEPWAANLIDSVRPWYFIKHENYLILEQESQQLAASLWSALHD
jgi:hypothetical protein